MVVFVLFFFFRKPAMAQRNQKACPPFPLPVGLSIQANQTLQIGLLPRRAAGREVRGPLMGECRVQGVGLMFSSCASLKPAFNLVSCHFSPCYACVCVHLSCF